MAVFSVAGCLCIGVKNSHYGSVGSRPDTCAEGGGVEREGVRWAAYYQEQTIDKGSLGRRWESDIVCTNLTVIRVGGRVRRPINQSRQTH